jgi:hypothetical protein
MRKHRKHMAKVLTATAVVSAALLTGSGAVFGGLADAAGPSTGGQVHFYYADAALDGNLGTVVLTGAVTDSGTDCQSCAGQGLNVFVLSKGTFEINVKQLGSKLPPTPVNPATCSQSGSNTAPIPIVSNSIWDTGAYTNIHGTFQGWAAEAALYPRGHDGKCDIHATSYPGVLIAHATGTISYR